jgi:mannitol-1-phosphate/altronate dehydrogenase
LREIAIVADDYGIEDAWPVFCEEFKQCVLEDIFRSDGRLWRRWVSSSCPT